MILETVWQYLANFNDREGFRILVLLMFLFGAPLVIGIWAKVAVWSLRQVRTCQQAFAAHDA